MKISHLIAAATLAVTALGAGTAANAQPRDGWRDGQRHEQRYDRHHQQRRWQGYNGHRRHCWTEWRHHRKVRVCR